MKRLFSIFLTTLLTFGLVGCGKGQIEQPISAIYTSYGNIEIISVEEAKEYSGEVNDCIRVRVMFTNNTKEIMFFSADNLMCRYDEEITDAAIVEDAVDILPPTNLNAGVSTVGNIYFYVPNGTEDIRIECTTEQGIAIFPFTIKDN